MTYTLKKRVVENICLSLIPLQKGRSPEVYNQRVQTRHKELPRYWWTWTVRFKLYRLALKVFIF